jgi:hypothetical protein
MMYPQKKSYREDRIVWQSIGLKLEVYNGKDYETIREIDRQTYSLYPERLWDHIHDLETRKGYILRLYDPIEDQELFEPYGYFDRDTFTLP